MKGWMFPHDTMQAKSLQCPNRSSASPWVNQLHSHWTCFGCECFSISAAFLLGAAASPGTLWAPRKAFQPGVSAGFVRIDFLCPFSLVLQRGQAVSHVSLSLFVKDSLPH